LGGAGPGWCITGRPERPAPFDTLRRDGAVIYETVKRAIDVVGSLAVINLFLPIWVLIGLAIRLTSPGPALYRGCVVGKGGKKFTYYKFRTMRANNDDSVHRNFIKHYVTADKPFLEAEPGKPVYKVVNDPRITPLGRILRRYSIDEFPQFINVLRGEMSIVGPRPPVCFEYDLYDDRARGRLAVAPGITGYAQVRKRGTASFSEMLDLDLNYVRRRSLVVDLGIMLQTLEVMVLRQGHTG
jgi:lipopolysaccharide/colanic/teichoic acid biosynthesis glycosyltransferase